MKIQLSFIVPVFNKKVIQVKRCISSILKIKKIKYEIILIDDGSKENLSNFYRRYAMKLGISYFHQKNKGVSSARNLGINVAKGKYLTFVDADDCIIPEALNQKLLDKNFDLIMFEVEKKNFSRGKDQIFKLSNSSREYKNNDLFKFVLQDGLLNWAVSKLYLNNFVKKNKLLFSTSISTGEDLDFIINFLNQNPTIFYVNKILYIYFYNDLSGIDRTLNDPERMLNDISYVWQKRSNLLNYLNLSNCSVYQKKIDDNYLKSLFEAFAISIFYNKKVQKNLYDIIFKKIDESKINLKKLDIGLKIKIFLFTKKNFLFIYFYYKLKKNIKNILAIMFDKKMRPKK